ncbi:MAG: hypothetical protein Q7K57_17985 [Burkholderiaceae bacterium]|nr:hypothetical protein [Polaromonas sp.]MDO8770553.1 hypothetical protein [Burkholderiaceae bacterium]
MSTTALSQTVYNTVVIRTWMVPGPGGDVSNPRVLSSYSIHGAPPVVMTGDGMETQEGAALAAINVVQRFLHEREWKRIFEDTVVEESEGKVDHYLAAHWANEGRAGQGDQEPAAAAREKLEQWRQSS